jgi:hypothetical protein
VLDDKNRHYEEGKRMKIKKCYKCGTQMNLINEKFEGILCESYRCPKCRTGIFTEEQARAFGSVYQQKLLKEKYVKKPVKIGHSYGMIFPREIVKAFNLDSKEAKFDINTDFSKGKIEITVL